MAKVSDKVQEEHRLGLARKQAHLWEMAFRDRLDGRAPVAIQTYEDDMGGLYRIELYRPELACGGYVLGRFHKDGQSDSHWIDYADDFFTAARQGYNLEAKIAAERLQIARSRELMEVS